MNIVEKKEEFTESLGTIHKAMDQLEASYNKAKYENEALWKALLKEGNRLVWNSLFTEIADNRDHFDTESIMEKIGELVELKRYSPALDGLNHLLKILDSELPSENIEGSISSILKNMFPLNIHSLDKRDKTCIEMLNWMKKTSGTWLGNTVQEYLYANRDKMNKFIASTKSPDVVLSYLSALLTFDLFSLLRDMMKYLLDKEWPFLDSRIQEGHFARFLWFSFYLSMDATLLEKSNFSSHFIDNKNVPEILLYKNFCEVKDAPETCNHTILEKMVHHKDQFSLFEESEKDKLLEEVMLFVKEQKKETVKPQLPTNLKKVSDIWQIKNNTEHCPHCSQSKLGKEKFLVDGYKKGKSKQSTKQITFELFSCSQCQRTYSNDIMNRKLKQALEPYRFTVKLDPIEYPPKKVAPKPLKTAKVIEIKPPVISKEEHYFAWPSTEVNKVKGSVKREGNFKEETSLHRLGYKITGLNRPQRWEILVRKAIPKLSLKEIVYTIAQNVRLRKAQSGGRTKFAYAIAEWEHDLNRLKKEYYNSNFSWPTY